MHAVAATLATQPQFLLAVMNSESGIRASAHNPNGHASGLIQFMPATLTRLGWTQGHEAFRRLTADEQMPFVERYYRPFVRQGLNSTARLYQATFLPATLSRGSEPGTVIVDVNANDNAFAYAPNRALDRRGDGRILVGDLTAFVERAMGSARWREALARLNSAVPGPVPPMPVPPLPVDPPIPVPPAPPPSVYRPTLRRGARGEPVREAQAKLNAVHSHNLAASLPGLEGAPLVVDGDFGPRTFNAVVSFQQQAFPASPAEWDGVIGPKTWAMLDAASAAAAIPTITAGDVSEDALPDDVLESGPGAVHPVLRRGAKGAAVREAQTKLNTVHSRNLAAARPGLRSAPLVVDGDFGPRTFNAVVSFQQQAFPASPPEWDGVIGPKTWAKLDAASAGAAITTITVSDVSEYVSLDYVLETLSGIAASVLTRKAAFRDVAALGAIFVAPFLALLLGGPIRRDPADATKFQTRIRMQLAFPATAAAPTVPAGAGSLPLAVLVHGNHTAYSAVGGVLSEKESFRGYRYLQEELARAGIASISVDTNMANELGSRIELRADIMLEAIKLLRRRASTAGSPLRNRIDFNRIALMGHSRGGDAVVRAVKKNSAASGADRFGIRTVCSLAPTDFSGGQAPASRTFIDAAELSFYSVLYGGLDGDVAGDGGSNSPVGTGFRHYDRARSQKALVFAERCCHNSWLSLTFGEDPGSGRYDLA